MPEKQRPVQNTPEAIGLYPPDASDLINTDELRRGFDQAAAATQYIYGQIVGGVCQKPEQAMAVEPVSLFMNLYDRKATPELDQSRAILERLIEGNGERDTKETKELSFIMYSLAKIGQKYGIQSQGEKRFYEVYEAIDKLKEETRNMNANAFFNRLLEHARDYGKENKQIKGIAHTRPAQPTQLFEPFPTEDQSQRPYQRGEDLFSISGDEKTSPLDQTLEANIATHALNAQIKAAELREKRLSTGTTASPEKEYLGNEDYLIQLCDKKFLESKLYSDDFDATLPPKIAAYLLENTDHTGQKVVSTPQLEVFIRDVAGVGTEDDTDDVFMDIANYAGYINQAAAMNRTHIEHGFAKRAKNLADTVVELRDRRSGLKLFNIIGSIF